MKAIILSAGQGLRLGHLVDDRPKCLIDFNGRSLLDRQLDTLEANGVREAVVVTGFHDELVSEAIARRSGGPTVRTIFNPFYKVADNTGSLFMARDELGGDCLVWNGDTLVSDALMRRVVGNRQQGVCVTIDRKDSYDEDDMRVVAADDGRLRAIGKRIAEGVNAEFYRASRLPWRRRRTVPRGHRASDANERRDDHLVPSRGPPPRAEAARCGRSISKARNGARWTSRRTSRPHAR